MRPDTEFRAAVLAWVARIPEGRLATYGQIALLAGFPRRPRQVGMVLKGLPEGTPLPWHRVVNAQGRTSPRSDGMGHDQLQRLMLRREGVRFSLQGVLSLARYRWHPRVTVEPQVTPQRSRRRTP